MKPAGSGWLALNGGGANSGYFESLTAANARVFYLGYATGTTCYFSLENGFNMTANGGTWTFSNTISGSITGSSASCSGNSASATTSNRSTIEDTRASQRTPNAYDDYRASYEFTNQITGINDWHTAFTMQGWHDGYSAWQIIGPASTSAHENFYLRSGINTSWNTLRTILHSGNYTSYSPSLTGSGASGTWGINITGSASTLVAGNSYTINRLVPRQSGVSLGSGNSSQIEVNNAGSGACNISFHREGAYGAHFGLDTDNWFSTYGWSAGAGYTSMRVGAFAANGAITATGNITAYYSDERLKTKLGNIPNALNKVLSLNGFYFEANETAQALGYTKKKEVGVSAQEVELVLPEIIAPAPIDAQYKTLDYGKLVPLLIEAIKDLNAKVDSLQTQLNNK